MTSHEPNNAALHVLDRGALAYPIETVPRIAGISRTRVFQEVRAGTLPARKAGRQTLILATDLRAWLEGLPIVDRASSAVENRTAA